MSDEHSADYDAGFWIEYGKHSNGFWIDARKVTGVRNVGKGGPGGSIILLDNGSEYATGYPATQVVALMREARARVIPPAVLAIPDKAGKRPPCGHDMHWASDPCRPVTPPEVHH